MKKDRQIVVASYGGGTNSTAGIALKVLRKDPIDLVLFADPGGEMPETYAFVKMFSNWLASHGYQRIISVSHFETLEQECLRNGRLPSKTFGYGSCSDKFKVRQQRKFIKNWKPAIDAWDRAEEIESLIFYDAGEPHRSENQKKETGLDKKFPLISEGIDRDECKSIIKHAGFCQPGKSSCFFCPSMKKQEIKSLQMKHPQLLERALNIERRGLQSLDGGDVCGLGRHFSWERFLQQGDLFPELFKDNYMEESCVCYDG